MMPGTGSRVQYGVGETVTFAFVNKDIKQLLPTFVSPSSAICAVPSFSMKSFGPPPPFPVPFRFLSSKSLRMTAIFFFICPRSFIVPLCWGTQVRNSCIFCSFCFGPCAASTSAHLSKASGGKFVGITHQSIEPIHTLKKQTPALLTFAINEYKMG